MQSLLLDFKPWLSKMSTQIKNENLYKVLEPFTYHLIIDENNDIYSNIDKISNRTSNIIFISEYIEDDIKYQLGSNFFIICIEKALIFVQQTEIKRFCHFFTTNQKSTIYFQTEKVRSKIEHLLNFKIQNSKEKHFTKEELKKFTREFSLHKSAEKTQIINFFTIVIENISSYLLSKAYNKAINYDRIANNIEYEEKPIYENEYIELRNIKENVINVCLIYHIEFEQLFALKIFFDEKLYERERLNYQRIHHPFFPKYYLHNTIHIKPLLLNIYKVNRLTKLKN